VRSGNWIGAALAGLATLPIPVLLTGCITTQQVAARARLVDARIRASQSPLRVTRQDPAVRVLRLSLVSGSGGFALAVQVRSISTHSLTDLPISVGLGTHEGGKVYLNRSANLDYDQTHVVSIPPHGLETWVYTSGRRLPGRGRPFADVGVTQLPEPVAATLPRVEVAREPSASSSATRLLSLSVSNRSGIPQVSVPVYAVVVRRGRVLAAGRATVAHLGTHSSATVHLTLLGSARDAGVRISVLPTIFQ
jgi:hypothetical protein